MNPFDSNQIRVAFKAGRVSQGEAIRLLTFHHGYSYMGALKFLGVIR